LSGPQPAELLTVGDFSANSLAQQFVTSHTSLPNEKLPFIHDATVTKM
jgi:hypothetical protein